MPELPEIETLRRSLKPLVGKTIDQITFSSLAPVETTTPGAIRKAMEGRAIGRIGRWGKYLLIQSIHSRSLVVHLGMSGQLRFYPDADSPKNLHTHMELFFGDGSMLRFVDARRFGTLSLSSDGEGRDNPFLKKLGPDYLDDEWSEAQFLKNCRRHPGISLKTLTLHQGIAAGLGNIYACEALYRAGLDPRRTVRRTRDEQLLSLQQAAKKVLALGIKHGGVSMRDYLDGNGHQGVMQKFLQVYDREGELSLDGRGIVKRIVQNARSTWFVPKVQR